MTTETIHLDSMPPEAFWKLTDWCHRQGADEFFINCIGIEPELNRFAEAFETTFAPFRREPAPRELVALYGGEEWVQVVPLWTLNPESLQLLRAVFPEGPFTYEGDAWFEDLILYRRTALMLGVITHEQEGFLIVTPEEQGILRRRETWFCAGQNSLY
ncbi:MAG: hypothetical protein KY468_20700 [Armatimonadetes bacterium]|nr:hypothetical protein [Armatimonadota bacterium]